MPGCSANDRFDKDADAAMVEAVGEGIGDGTEDPQESVDVGESVNAEGPTDDPVGDLDIIASTV